MFDTRFTEQVYYRQQGKGSLQKKEQAQICAEGCEEEYISKSFKFRASLISVIKRGFSRLNEVKRY